jgi:hypothetical protein
MNANFDNGKEIEEKLRGANQDAKQAIFEPQEDFLGRILVLFYIGIIVEDIAAARGLRHPGRRRFAKVRI